MSIDWSKAPEWAVAHGLHETGFGIKEFWLGETKHQNLEHTKSFPYGGGDPSRDSFHNYRRESFSYVTPRPALWTGEGLPPVGTVCEYTSNGGLNWRETSVLFIDEQVVLLTGYALYKLVDPDIAFRPIRTPEQIAAEERESAVNGMLCHDALGGSRRGLAEALYDAGYRLQVKP